MEQMDSAHWVLTLLWILYGFLHSLLASVQVKKFLSRILQHYFHYYRFFYSIFAFLSLAGILWFQYSINSPGLFESPPLLLVILLPILAIGVGIMGISIAKYFSYLSGIDVFKQKRAEDRLDTRGIHQYVRHPLYLGTLMVIWVLFLIFPKLNNLIAVSIITLYTLIGIKLEERKLVGQFGVDYLEYRKKVPMLFPHIF